MQKRYRSLPRVGKKTAEQIILSLKGKLVRVPEKSGRSVSAASAGVVGFGQLRI
jgi:Holliday junction resolvasome RuvABC DNA-binding subunit